MIKRIIAMLAVVLMLVMTLSSCGEIPMNGLEDDLASISQPVEEYVYNPRYNCAQSREEYVVTPQRVDLPEIPYKLFCGEFNITVIGNEGIYTWGSNYRNQFLNPDKENTFAPQKIDFAGIIE